MAVAAAGASAVALAAINDGKLAVAPRASGGKCFSFNGKSYCE